MPAIEVEKTQNTSFGQNLPENASFEMASAEIRGTLTNRGSVGSVLAEAAELDRRLMKSRIEYPDSYVLGDIIAADSSTVFRSGNDEGNPYMTVEDYKNFCLSEQQKMRDAHRERYERTDREAERIRNMKKPPALHPAAPYGIGVATVPGEEGSRGKKMTVFKGNEDCEMAVRDSLDETGLERLKRVYLPDEKTVNAGISSRHASSSIAAIASVMVFALLLSLPIGLRILNYNETKTIAGIKSEIAAEQTEINQLKVDLTIRNEEEDIETLAREKFGMVRLDVSSYEILKINRGDTIINEEKSGKESGTVPALLNALGIHIGK